MSLSSLSAEIILMVCDKLDEASDINSWLQTAPKFAEIINPVLYRLSQDRLENSALKWAAKAGSKATLERAMSYGCVLDDRRILEAAVYAKQSELVSLMLSNSPDFRATINIADGRGRTLLYEAATDGNLEITTTLLEYGADPRQLCDEDLVRQNADENDDQVDLGDDSDYVKTLSAICGAAEFGYPDVVRILLDYGADVCDDSVGWPPICLAAAAGSSSTVDMLLLYGAHFDEITHGGATPMYIAAANGHVELVEMFLQRSTLQMELDARSSRTPLHAAAESGYADVIEVLAKFGANINTSTRNGWSPLHSASMKGYTWCVQVLLKWGAKSTPASQTQRTPIYHALERGYIELAKLLIDDSAADFRDSKNITPLILAAKLGQLEAVELLVGRGADVHAVDNDGFTALTWASHRGDDDAAVAKFLLENGADANVESAGFAWTPMHMAAYQKRENIVQTLLDFNGDPTRKATSGSTPLHIAALVGSEETVNLLAKLTVIRMDQQDLNGRTPLFHATIRGHVEIVKAILYNDNPPADGNNNFQYSPGNLPDVYGAYPAFSAVRNQFTDIIRLLLEADSSVLSHTDKFGRNILWWALNTGNTDVIKVVSEYCEPLGIVSIPLIEAAANPTPSEAGCWCEICTMSDRSSATHACCNICNGGRYLICGRCRDFGIGCRDSHELGEFDCN